jgi:hypothetical protein
MPPAFRERVSQVMFRKCGCKCTLILMSGVQDEIADPIDVKDQEHDQGTVSQTLPSSNIGTSSTNDDDDELDKPASMVEVELADFRKSSSSYQVNLHQVSDTSGWDMRPV